MYDFRDAMFCYVLLRDRRDYNVVLSQYRTLHILGLAGAGHAIVVTAAEYGVQIRRQGLEQAALQEQGAKEVECKGPEW